MWSLAVMYTNVGRTLAGDTNSVLICHWLDNWPWHVYWYLCLHFFICKFKILWIKWLVIPNSTNLWDQSLWVSQREKDPCEHWSSLQVMSRLWQHMAKVSPWDTCILWCVSCSGSYVLPSGLVLSESFGKTLKFLSISVLYLAIMIS